MALNIQTFKTRALTAIAFVAVMLSGLLINGFLFSLLFLVILVGCLWEFSKINKIINQKISIKFYFAALFYIVCPIIMMLGLASDFHYMDLIFKAKYYPALPCLIIFSIWINDTMAYLVGSFIGKTPFSSISPKKTWEGTIGGAVLCVATIALYTILFDPNHEFTLKFNITIAFICSVFGTIGDLLPLREFLLRGGEHGFQSQRLATGRRRGDFRRRRRCAARASALWRRGRAGHFVNQISRPTIRDRHGRRGHVPGGHRGGTA